MHRLGKQNVHNLSRKWTRASRTNLLRPRFGPVLNFSTVEVSCSNRIWFFGLVSRISFSGVTSKFLNSSGNVRRTFLSPCIGKRNSTCKKPEYGINSKSIRTRHRSYRYHNRPNQLTLIKYALENRFLGVCLCARLSLSLPVHMCSCASIRNNYQQKIDG